MQSGPGFWVTFLYYFASTTVVLALVLSRGADLSVASGLPQSIGAAGGVIAGLVAAYFNRSSTLTLPCQNSKKFLIQLENLLTAQRFEFVAEEEGVRLYDRSGLSGWFSGKILVKFEGSQVSIASRAANIRWLRRECIAFLT